MQGGGGRIERGVGDEWRIFQEKRGGLLAILRTNLGAHLRHILREIDLVALDTLVERVLFDLLDVEVAVGADAVVALGAEDHVVAFARVGLFAEELVAAAWLDGESVWVFWEMVSWGWGTWEWLLNWGKYVGGGMMGERRGVVMRVFTNHNRQCSSTWLGGHTGVALPGCW